MPGALVFAGPRKGARIATLAISAARQASIARAPAANLAGRSAALVDHHADTSNPDKPLYLLIPGGAIAILALLYAIYSAFLGIVIGTPAAAAWLRVIAASLVYLGGLFVFSYGYELYNAHNALRMTLKLGLVGLAVLFIAIVIFLIIAAIFKDSDGDLSLDSGSSSGGSSGFSILGNMFDWATRMPDIANVVVNTVGQNMPAVTLGLPHVPGTCSFCSRPLPAGGAVKPDASADPGRFCPKCGQAFEAAGDNARASSATAR